MTTPPATSKATAETAPLPAATRQALEGAPITQTLQGQVQSLDLAAGTLVMHYQLGDQYLNPARQVQGGMIGALLDDVTAVLVTATLEPGAFCATLNLNISFLSPGQPGLLVGQARFERRGKSVCNVRGEIWQGTRLVATATAVCMIRRADA